jgi:hypothetical protein
MAVTPEARHACDPIARRRIGPALAMNRAIADGTALFAT